MRPRRILSDEEVRQLFRKHVPEIAMGEVEIQTMVREPGRMTVVAVRSQSPRIQAITACVGNRGSRSKEMAREFGHERLAIVLWFESAEDFIRNAVGIGRDRVTYTTPTITLEPASHEARVEVDRSTRANLLANDGLLLKLVSKLVGWKLNLTGASGEEVA